MRNFVYVHNKQLKKSFIDTARRLVLVTGGILAIAIPASQLPSFASAKGAGGTPGDGFTYIINYNADSCPLPQSIKADYENILTCALVKRTGQNRDYTIRVDGFTQLTPVVRTINKNVLITLPCGNQAVVNKFTENAFAQTLPVPPPYRLFTESVKFTDTCL